MGPGPVSTLGTRVMRVTLPGGWWPETGPKRWGQWSHQTQRYVTCWVSCPSPVSLDTDNSQHCTHNDDHNLAGTHSGHPRSVELSRDLKVYLTMKYCQAWMGCLTTVPWWSTVSNCHCMACMEVGQCYNVSTPVFNLYTVSSGIKMAKSSTGECCQCDPVWHWSHTCLVSTVNGATLWRFSLHYTIILQLSAGQARSNNNSQCWGNHSWCKCHVRQQSESILSRHWTDKITKNIFHCRDRGRVMSTRCIWPTCPRPALAGTGVRWARRGPCSPLTVPMVTCWWWLLRTMVLASLVTIIRGNTEPS